jgi:hypothetical protein
MSTGVPPGMPPETTAKLCQKMSVKGVEQKLLCSGRACDWPDVIFCNTAGARGACVSTSNGEDEACECSWGPRRMPEGNIHDNDTQAAVPAADAVHHRGDLAVHRDLAGRLL